jgi:Ca2+-transporting ATPase
LKPAEAKKRLRKFGPNRLRATKQKSVYSIFIAQLKNLIVLLLTAAAALFFLFGQTMEGVSIVAVIIINTAIGFFTELRAVRSMEALKQMTRVKTKVRRGRQTLQIPAGEVLPGDVVVFEGGGTS